MERASGREHLDVHRLAVEAEKGGAAPVGAVTNIVRGGIGKADPFSKGINKNDVADTGAESVRLARRTVETGKRGVRSTKRALNKTRRAIKTTARAAKATARGAYRTARYAARAVYLSTRFTVRAAIHIVAIALNPITWVICGILVVFLICASLIVMLFGSEQATTVVAAAGAIGLEDVTGQRQQGLEFFDNAVASSQSAFYDSVNTPVYTAGDLPNSDFVSLWLTRADGTPQYYATGYAWEGQKSNIRNAWNFPLSVDEVMAIAYVYLEKAANAANGTTGIIYPVIFTQTLFDEIIALCAAHSSNIYTNQTCPASNCIPAAPPDNPNASCAGAHSMHNVELRFHSIDDVMDALGFTDFDRQWLEATVWGFENI
jgi:hypothetical protein